MHPRALAERRSTAQARIKAAAATLAERHNISPLAPVAPVDARDPQIGAMRELENIADLLDSLVAVSAAPQVEADAPRKRKNG